MADWRTNQNKYPALTTSHTKYAHPPVPTVSSSAKSKHLCYTRMCSPGRVQYESGNELYCSTTVCPSYGASACILVTAYPVGPSRSHSDTPHSAGVFWTSVISPTQWPLHDNAQPCHRRDSNPQSQRASGHRPLRNAFRHAVFFGRGSSLADVHLCVETLWSIDLLLQETLAQIQPVSKMPDYQGVPCPIQVFCNWWITTLRCDIPVVLVQKQRIFVYYTYSRTQLYFI